MGEPMGTKVHSSISFLLPIQSKISEQPVTWLLTCFHAGILVGLFDPEDESNMFLQNIS
jgi:hypothetical protein